MFVSHCCVTVYLCNHKQMHYLPSLFTLTEETFTEYKGTQLQSSAIHSMHVLWSDGFFQTEEFNRSGLKKIFDKKILLPWHAHRVAKQCLWCEYLMWSLCWGSQAIRIDLYAIPDGGMSLAVVSWCCIYSSKPGWAQVVLL